MHDYLDILGLSRDTPAEVIRRASVRRARHAHPDFAADDGPVVPLVDHARRPFRAFADVADEMRPSASALATMTQQVSLALGVALAASMLGVSKALRGAEALALTDFRAAWLVTAAVMTVATLWSLRLTPEAGRALSQRA